MYITKTKTYNTISIAEIKNDLKVHDSDEDYTAEINRLVKASVGIAEKFIGADIVPTTNSLEDYFVSCSYYQINEPNITISAITINDTTQVTGFTVYKYNQYTLIKFNNVVSADKIRIVFTSGYSVIPHDIQRAILLKIGELFDADRNGYVTTSLKETKAFERILSPYVNHIY